MITLAQLYIGGEWLFFSISLSLNLGSILKSFLMEENEGRWRGDNGRGEVNGTSSDGARVRDKNVGLKARVAYLKDEAKRREPEVEWLETRLRGEEKEVAHLRER